MRQVAEETGDTLQGLKDNDSQRDLHKDNEENERELFSQEFEIHITDTYLNSRIMIGTLDEVDSHLTQFFEKAKQLSAEEHEVARRFTGAIASIMLLPTFIVGLYGQNFVDMPETDWHYGYLFHGAPSSASQSSRLFSSVDVAGSKSVELLAHKSDISHITSSS